jgi:hypothetical protein
VELCNNGQSSLRADCPLIKFKKRTQVFYHTLSIPHYVLLGDILGEIPANPRYLDYILVIHSAIYGVAK